MRTIDWQALVKGAAVSIVVCLPLALLAEVLVDRDDPSSLSVPLYLGVLLGFVAGGFVAARHAVASHLVTGALAASAAFVVIQGAGVVVRVANGEEVLFASIVFTALLAYGCGLTGAVAGERRRAR